jgi:serine/threonine protein kinase/Tfp pilus assembly protein PilF
MSEERLNSLLSSWQKLQSDGRDPPAAELCCDCPELAQELNRRIDALRRMNDLILPAGAASGPDAAAATPTPASANSPTDIVADGKGQTPSVPGANPPEEAALPASVPGYDLLGELGRGGMGVVYKARHQHLQRLVALKMIRGASTAGPDELARFRTEAEAIARLQHPHIVQIFEVGAYDGLPYFALEYCAGGSLEKKLAGTPLAPQAAARLVETLARAMQAAHHKGIIHRDLKPANVLLATEGTEDTEKKSGLSSVPSVSSVAGLVPKITDFGLAKKLDAAGPTAEGAVMGTPSYMAPEQASGRSHTLGPACDVYALGAILYECLTGRPPFKAATPLETILQVAEQEPVPPRQLQPRLPRDLETICLACLRKEPGKRYATALALAEDLRRFQQGEPIQQRPVGRLERLTKWARRRPAVAALTVGLVAAMLLLVFGGSAAAIWYANDRAELRLEEAGRQMEQALQQAQQQTRSQQVNREVHAALDETERHLQDLRMRLEDPLKACVLLSAIQEWEGLVVKSQQAWQRAQALSAGHEAWLKPATVSRMQAVKVAWQQAEGNYRLGKELDDIRLEAATTVPGKFQYGKVAPAYRAFFVRQGLDVVQGNTEQLGTALRKSPIRYALVAALDHWAETTMLTGSEDRQLLPVLLELARRADSDPWRDQFRQVAAWKSLPKLQQLAADLDPSQQSPQTLVAFGTRLHEMGGDAGAVLRRALLPHPHDFWLHFELARNAKEGGEKIARYQAALAIRSKSAVALNNLGLALREHKDSSGAVVAYRQAIKLDPQHAIAYYNLGFALRDQKDLAGAAAAFRQAIKLDPQDALAHNNLGTTLLKQNDLLGAVAAFHQAIKIDRQFAPAHYNLSLTLSQQGKFQDALTAMQQAHALGARQPGWTSPSAKWVLRLTRILELSRQEQQQAVVTEGARKGVVGQLSKQDPLDVFDETFKSFRQSYPVHLKAGQAYQIDLTGDFDVFLRLEDANYLTLAFNDDVTPPDNLNARLVFTPKQDGVYRLVVTSYEPGATGKFQLTVKEVKVAGPAVLLQGELNSSDLVAGGKFRKVHKVELVAGRPYVFELDSPRFDSYLLLLDPTGKQTLDINDDAGDFVSASRIDFTPKESGSYLVIATSFDPGETGPYTLRIQGYEPAPANEPMAVPSARRQGR